MTYLPKRIAVLMTQILGWFTLGLFTLAAIAAIPSGNGVVGLLGSLAVAVCPGAALVYGARQAFDGEAFWYKTVLVIYAILGTGFGAWGFSTGNPAFVMLYPFLLVPPVVLVASGKPTTDSELNAKRYLIVVAALYGAAAVAAWVLAILD